MLQDKIIVSRPKCLDVTVVHVIVNEACRFYSSIEILHDNHFLNLKSMKNTFQFFQEAKVGEIIITCQGYDEFYAIQQIVKVLERYLVENRPYR